MFSGRMTTTSTADCSAEIIRLKDALKAADAVLIGAGADLSAAAGFTYTGERFEKYFSDFIRKYGFTDMYSGGFYPFETPEEHWAYWSRYIYINRYADVDNGVYKKLFELVKDKSLFSIFLRTSFRQSFAADCVKKPCNTASITAAFCLVIDKILPKIRTPKDTEQALRIILC